jgi:hypothetical protein
VLLYVIGVAVSVYSPCGPWPLFQCLNLCTADRASWTGDQPVARPLPTHSTTQTQNKRAQTSMPRVVFEPTIAGFERAKTSCLRPRGHCQQIKNIDLNKYFRKIIICVHLSTAVENILARFFIFILLRLYIGKYRIQERRRTVQLIKLAQENCSSSAHAKRIFADCIV